ncbi:gcrA cell cycle regulator family protein [Vibrio metschnikovii]|uniref:gcrA cell cycle regulator family protein n=1 Tax=Vibrio metschnikovii TaxID=28172 RepID=UPI001C2F7AB0|nr:gcrA cell cycle regulator family protein [Vibrio metschnikovii]EKO3914617.1 gcrA cell cycle regulator family protein [Vibrio metschnikovii]
MENTSFIAQDINPDCTFSDLLIRRPQVSDKAVSLSKIEKPRLKTTKKRWTEEESKLLIKLFHEGKSLPNMAKTLERTTSAVDGQIRKLKLKRFRNLSDKEIRYLKDNYWLLDTDTLAKRLGRQVSAIRYFLKKLGLKRPSLDTAEPPIPRRLMPYDMVKRVSVLERNCPFSKSRVQDSVVIFYDKTGPSVPMMAMHLDELCEALDCYFGRRSGVTATALMYGFKAV